MKLSPEDNTTLMVNLGVESVLEEIIGEFKGVKEWKDVLSRNLRNNRISQRILLTLIWKVEKDERNLREIGDSKLGIAFYPEAPFKSIFGPKEVHDHLAYTTSLPLPLPTLPDVLDGTTSVSQEDAEKIRNSMKVTETIMKGFRDNAVKVVMELYDIATEQVLNTKNDVNFYL